MTRRPARWLLALIAPLLCAACVGSDKPRAAIRSQALEKPFVPPVDPNPVIPFEIQRRNYELQRSRLAIKNAVRIPYNVSPWTAADKDIADFNAPRRQEKTEGEVEEDEE